MKRKIGYHIPMLFVLTGIVLFLYFVYFAASIRISKILFKKAQRGARGKAVRVYSEENIVANPN